MSDEQNAQSAGSTGTADNSTPSTDKAEDYKSRYEEQNKKLTEMGQALADTRRVNMSIQDELNQTRLMIMQQNQARAAQPEPEPENEYDPNIIVKKATEQVIRTIAPVLQENIQMKNEVQAQKLQDYFFSMHPDLKEFQDLVMLEATHVYSDPMVQKGHVPQGEVFERIAGSARNRIQQIRGASRGADNPPPYMGGMTPSADSAGGKGTPAEEEVSDADVMSLIHQNSLRGTNLRA